VTLGTLAPTASARAVVAIAAPEFESERLWGDVRDNRWEPANAADPSSRWVYQMTTDQVPDFLLFRASPDGGKSWGPQRHLCRRGVRVRFQYDPQIAVGADGTIYAACLDNFSPGVVFSRSRDHGATWRAPVRVDGSLHYSDKPQLVISPSGRDVYIAFNARFALYVASSHDYGATWGSAVKASVERLWYYPYGGAVAPDGSVWFAVDGEGGHGQTRAGHVEAINSGDGGTTWHTTPLALSHGGAPCPVRNCYPDFFTAQDAIAVDLAGNFVFAYAKNDVRQGPNALYVRRSPDGVRWSEPVAINALGNNTSPALVTGPGVGDFRLVWQDNRNGPRAWNTWYVRSVDGGATWGPQARLSDRGGGAPYKSAAGYEFPFGDYLGLSVDSEGVNHVIWGEGSAVYVPGGSWWTRGL
jgi:hypothetical protein